MTENLRDRIAAVLNRHKTDGDRHNEWSDCQCGHVGTRWDDHVADAVIAELGLKVEFGWLDHEDSGMLYDSLDEARESTHGSGETLRSRLVSDWEDVPVEPAEESGLMERLVMAALDALADGDPVIKIGIGNAEIRIGWW